MSLLIFLPLLCLFIFSVGFIGYLVQHKTKIRSTCLNEGRRIQENLVRNEESILKLNNLVSALRLRLKLAYAELAAATAAENPIWMARAQAKILAIQRQQKQLDTLQQSLIKKAKFEVLTQTLNLQNQMNQIDQQTNRIWQFYLDIFAFSILEHKPEVALERDSPDVAPIYELSSDYERKQRLALIWQSRFETKTNAQKVLSSHNKVEFKCRVGAKKEGQKWNLLINVGKS